MKTFQILVKLFLKFLIFLRMVPGCYLDSNILLTTHLHLQDVGLHDFLVASN